jgi:predicted nucleic acid-binding protein
MAKDIVIDSCVAAKWFLPEADSPAAIEIMRSVTVIGGQLILLDLARIEVCNAIWKYQRRKQITPDQAIRLLDSLLRLPTRIESAETSLRDALAIAARYDRSVYDAIFVATTRRLHLQGVTADEPLFNAVKADYPEILLLKHLPSGPMP